MEVNYKGIFGEVTVNDNAFESVNQYAIVNGGFEIAENVYYDDTLVHPRRHQILKVAYKKRQTQRYGINQVSKRAFDIIFSVMLMLLGFPVFAVICLITKFSSAGPAFFKQERRGRYGRAFHIYKFRSMYVDAEKHGPRLSSTGDPRITKWGRVIRRSRLDELPQFWNVLKGDMSIVGPRPERQCFIDQIIAIKPYYQNLHSVKPGITSMGQVHYGYAENVHQMCERMEYDLKYLQKANLLTDMHLIAKTVKVMVQGKGK